ncbi:hypothetical protein ACHHYP_10048 [Achlya hypogyna]|uniref:Secreted protein n=1 Tax=Achlya hypogyna TaxID=1202772 RepID=A0A1V9ZJ02_ACHHY|nr:hypothetical protein ACHHYP_10048 [Achlya hypogyna]
MSRCLVAGLAAVAVSLTSASAATCLASGTTPTLTSSRYPLVFCQTTGDRCCLPAHDQAILTDFLLLLNTGTFAMRCVAIASLGSGASCAETLNPAKTSLARVMCAACNPSSPQYLSVPTSATFFSAPQTFKVCARLAAAVAPVNFDECGISQPAYRGSICSPNNAVSSTTWAACSDGAYVCQNASSQAFYCNTTPCTSNDVPAGFANVPCATAEGTCGSAFLFLNDNGGAKPVLFEKFPVEIVPAGNDSCLDVDDALTTAVSGSSNALSAQGIVLFALLITFVCF